MEHTRGYFTYSLKMGNMLLRRGITCAANPQDLITCQLLPLWVHSKEYSSPNQEVRSGVFPSKEEALTLFDNVTFP